MDNDAGVVTTLRLPVFANNLNENDKSGDAFVPEQTANFFCDLFRYTVSRKECGVFFVLKNLCG